MAERPVAVIVLAAGNSSRMGMPKQLLEFRGKPLLRHAVEVALEADVGPVIVVLGAREQELRTTLQGMNVVITVNHRWEEGMGRSIQAGLTAIPDERISGAVLTLADQPFVTSRFLQVLVKRHRESGAAIVASRYSGTVGVPAFFTRAAFEDLKSLPPDQGCKGIIFRHSNDALLEDCPAAAVDIDTPEDFNRAVNLR
jgi:molybdenum cofactor cytidylyltransferase